MCDQECSKCHKPTQVSHRHMCYDKVYRLPSIIFESEQRQCNGSRHYVKSLDAIMLSDRHEKVAKIRFR